MNDWDDKVLALAGVAQAATCVQRIARTGEVEPAAASHTLINSVFITNPSSTVDVYGSIPQLLPGLRTLLDQIGAARQKDVELTRYIVGMLYLARRLSKKPQQLQALGQRIEQVQRQREMFDFAEHRVLENLASIYKDLISPLAKPMHINGHPDFLSKPANQHHIRALLLAGVRSAILWLQVGGKRRHFIFSRRAMAAAAQQLLRRL